MGNIEDKEIPFTGTFDYINEPVPPVMKIVLSFSMFLSLTFLLLLDIGTTGTYAYPYSQRVPTIFLLIPDPAAPTEEGYS